MSDMHPSVSRLDAWLRYNGDPGWPGEDQAVIDDSTPQAPLLRRDVAWIVTAYHRLRGQNLLLKNQRDQLARLGEKGGEPA